MIKNSFRWIASHQVASFFIITFLITWGLGFSYIAVMREKYLFLPLMFLATCGPGLAGIIVASHTQERSRRRSWMAGVRASQATVPDQSSYCGPVIGSVLGAMASVSLDRGGKRCDDLIILDQFIPPSRTFRDNSLLVL